jgi:hypothetical protein
MKAVISTKTQVNFYQTTWGNIPEDKKKLFSITPWGSSRNSSVEKNALSFIPHISCVQTHPYKVPFSPGQKYDMPL